MADGTQITISVRHYAILSVICCIALFGFYQQSADIVFNAGPLVENVIGDTKVTFKELFNKRVISERPKTLSKPIGTYNSSKTLSKPIRTYHSSAWEQWWLDNIEQQEKSRTICETIISHEHTREFLNATASKRYEDWLYFDDHTHGGVWFNVKNGKFSGSIDGPSFCPEGVSCYTLLFAPPITRSEFDPAIFSWFETKYENGVVTRDYIEPLVGHLRHPMACRLQPGQPWLVDRTYIVPPPAHMLKPGARAHYYDAGASVWCSGPGGGSLCFFTRLWEDNGITFDRIRAWDGGASQEAAEKSYPAAWKPKIQFSSSWVSTSAEQPDAFVPLLIKAETKKDDYVLFKLDIDHGDTEIAIVNYMVDESNDVLEWIDEFVWEQHCTNYIMAQNWLNTIDPTKTIRDSYQYFLKLRQRGVRAHSYV